MSSVVDLKQIRRDQFTPSLDALTSLTAHEMRRVNQTIIAHMDSPVILIRKVAEHVVAAGGKRLRPMLTLASAGLCGYTGERHIGLAACVEFIHTATLLHDDVVDEDMLRRGTASANAVWGNKASVLVGDFLFSRAFELMVADGALEVLRVLSEASSTIAEGEVMQLITANDVETSEAAYLEVISSKTARLFAAATEVGAIVADASEAERRALESFGYNTGMAFQLIDDVLDYSAHQAILGKTVSNDFKEGKITLPVLFAYGAADKRERTFWHRTLVDLDQGEGDFGHALKLLNQSGALTGTVDRAREYAVAAQAALDQFPDGRIRAALLEAVEFVVDRSY